MIAKEGPLPSDVHDRATRSRNMAAIRGRNTKPEIVVRRGLHARGLRYRLHRKDLPGKPDLTFPSRRTVVFVNGCFWHAHEGCRFFKLPAKDREWWREKLEGNRERDERNHARLCEAGWRVIVVWECDIRGRSAREVSDMLDRLAESIRS